MASTRPQRFDSSSIRRKEETEELLVFGYSCKLFRDDEKALYIDQGKHLIPWMGDDTLKIDRYDVRGTVYDLRSLEPLGGGASDALWSSLSDAERKVEQLCDEERYRALYHNEAEETMYQEEELKRLHKALDPQNSYGQVAYSYDNETDQDESTVSSSKETSDTNEEEDEPFIPPQELDIPVGMVLPERTKLNAIIEKTAAFINTQGPQMEIILKMKQANNPQFSFLSFDCPLHAYYRHLLMAIKTGRYRTKQEREQQEQNDFENTDHYLHPSLATATKPVELAPSIPSISYKPSADCAYSMLVNKIKDRLGKLTDDGSGPSSPGDAIGRDDSTSDHSSIVSPPADIQVIIDKMASYVIKNGRDFESVVRSKGDERFGFLDAGHKYHPYYEHKVRVYQGLESPQSFSQLPSTAASSQKQIQSTGKKKSPEKNRRPILLPGYDFSDDSSESDDDETDGTKAELGGKPKLAPVCFSIKKPKEAEILKEVKSALPVEEESSDEEADGGGESASKLSSTVLESNAVEQVQDQGEPSGPTNPEEEMRRLQQLLKEKEKQLREQERQRKLTEKRSQDIFQIEATETPSLPQLLESAPPLPARDTADSRTVENDEECKDTIKCEEIKSTVKSNISSLEKRDEVDVKEKSPDTDDLLNEISETEIIDLTEEVDDAPKVTDTMRLERKRKAAAFLSRLQKQRPLSKNGGSHPTSDSDTASRHSTPSPTHLKRENLETGITNFHEAGIPRTSLMARLAASTQMPRHQTSEKKKISKERLGVHRKSEKSESPVKSSKERDERSRYQLKSKRKKESSPPLELEHERSRSRSRSMSYSRSPSHKRRQGEDSDSEQRSHRKYKEGKSSHRKKHESSESIEGRDHGRHHRRHEEERRSHSLSHSHNHNSDQIRGRSHGRGLSQSRSQTKKIDVQVSDVDSSD